METSEVNVSSKNKMIWGAVIILVVLAVIGFFVFGGAKVNNLFKGKVESVATVNGVSIPKATFDAQLASAISSYQAQGVDVASTTILSQIKTQVLDGLVNNELLFQGATAAGIKTSDADVEAQYQTVLTQVGGADKLKAELVKNNLTDAQLRENIAKQAAIQTYLLQNIDTKSLTASDAEIAQFYDNYSKAQKASGATTTPALKDLSAQIKQQIILNKQNTLVANFVATLRAKATIVIVSTL